MIPTERRDELVESLNLHVPKGSKYILKGSDQITAVSPRQDTSFPVSFLPS